jgi:hypothetical protein
MAVLRRFNGCGADRKAVWAGSSELGFTRVQKTKSLLADLSELSLVKTAGSFLQMTGHWSLREYYVRSGLALDDIDINVRRCL